MLKKQLCQFEYLHKNRREEALVPRQHPEVALAPGQDDGVDGLREDLALRGHDGELHGYLLSTYTRPLAFSTASSIVPTM